MQCFIALAVFGTLVSTLGVIQAYADENKIYENPDFGLKIQYPSDWEVKENPNEYVVVGFTSPLESQSDVWKDYFVVSVEGISGISLDEYVESSLNSLESVNLQYGLETKDIKSEPTVISENAARKITYTLEGEGSPKLSEDRFITKKGDFAYSITFTVEFEKYDQYLPVIQDVIDSIEIESLPPYFQYENAALGIKLEYPSSWIKSEVNQPVPTVVLTSPYDSIQDPYLETFSIIVTQVPSGTSVTAKDLADIVMGNYEQQFPNFALVDSGPTQLSGNSAFQKAYSATLAGIDVQGTNVFYVFGDKAYMVQYIVDKAKASQYMPIIQKMLDSLVVDQGMMPVEFSGKYVHDRTGLEIDMPDSWNGMKIKQQGLDIAFATSGISTKMFSSEVDPNFSMIMTMVGSFDKIKEMNSKPECSVPPTGTIMEIEGRKTVEVAGTCLEPTFGVDLKMLTYTFATNDDIVMISYAAGSDSAFEKDLDKFKESFKTIKISDTIDVSNPKNYAKIFGLDLSKEKILVDSQEHEVTIVGNVTLTDFIFDQENNEISFGTSQKSGVGQVELFVGKIIPAPYTLTIDGQNNDDFYITDDKTTGDTIISLYFDLPVQKVAITGNNEISSLIPDWIRSNAEWWAQGAIGDSDFVSGIQYLIKEGIITIPQTTTKEGDPTDIPSWIKNNADWWSQGLITDEDFLKGIEYMVENGIIQV